MITFEEKAFNDKNETLKLLFAEGSLKALNIFRQFLMRAFESR